jgi:hypothetical protein
MARPSTNGYSIAQLEQMLLGRRAEVQRLERQRDRVARKLDKIERRITALGGSVGRGRPRGSGGGGRRARNEMSLNDAIEAVLKGSGKAMKVGDIADAVQSKGYRSNSANFRGIVNQALIKDKRFGAASRGLYQLKK